MDARSDSLLHDLQRGEREAFVRYYELYRAPVHDLVWRLLRDGEDAVSATQEVFTTAYRRILLNDGPVDLRDWTYGAAIDVCRERLDEREADGDAAPSTATGADRREPSDLGGRFAQALETVEFRYQAVLLLHDIHGLRVDQMATVFGVTEDAASALLFRAREAFRRAFEELSSDQRTATCRLAEQAAAGAVGRTLSDGEVRRLGEHAAFCRPCRRTMKGWGGDAIGLGLFLEAAPLPQALETTPVFGTTIPIAGASSAVADSGTLTRGLARIGCSLTSKAAAYALAAACLAVAVGLSVQQSEGDRAFIAAPATGPSVPPLVRPATSVLPPSISRSGQTVATSARSATRSPVATSARLVTLSPASLLSYAGETAPTLAAVAEVRSSSRSGRPTVGHQVASAAEEASAVTHQGHRKGRSQVTKRGRVSALRGHSSRGNGSHAEPAGTRHGRAAKHHAEKAKKSHAGKHHEHKKSKKNH